MLTVLLWVLSIYLALGIVNLCVVSVIDKQIPNLRGSIRCIMWWPIMWLVVAILKVIDFKIL